MSKISMRGLLLFCVVSVLSSSAFAQKKIKRGVATYEIIEVVSTQPETEMMMGAKMEICFDNKRHKMDMSLMEGMIRIQTIIDQEKKENIVLTDIAGRQIKVISDFTEQEENKVYNILYDKKNRKKIAGYDCYKATLKSEDGELLELYVTSKINPKSSFFDQLFPGLKGFPLEYTINSHNLRMTYLAKAILGKPDFEQYFMIPDTYLEMNPEDFSKELGVMNFGF